MGRVMETIDALETKAIDLVCYKYNYNEALVDRIVSEAMGWVVMSRKDVEEKVRILILNHQKGG